MPGPDLPSSHQFAADVQQVEGRFGILILFFRSSLYPFPQQGAGVFAGRLKNGQAPGSRLKCYIKLLDDKFPSVGIKPEQFAMHSFRRGGPTDAWESGVDRELLKLHGRQRSEAINGYLQAPIRMRLRVTGFV